MTGQRPRRPAARRRARSIIVLSRLVVRAGGALAAVALLVSGCSGSDDGAASSPPPPPATPPAAQPSSPFAYDSAAPLALRDRGRVNENYPIAIRDVSYASRGGRVDAYLAVPPGKARRPAAVVLHGAGGDRGQLLLNALWLAGRGAVTLAITAPSSRQADTSRSLTPEASLRRQRDLAVRDVVAIRRGLDLLAGRPDVDRERLGFLGWSAGARTGAVLAGVEPRLDALVLMSGGAAPVDEYAARAPANLRPAVRRLLGEVDPLRHIGRAQPEQLLVQNGRQDEVVPSAALEALVAAAPVGADVRWYDAGHELDVPAYRQQLDWLAERLDAGPVVRGARTGP